MDLLNRAYSQFYELFRSMTPAGRAMAGTATMVVLVSLGYLGTHGVSAKYVDLMHGATIAASDLPAMEAAFAKAKLKTYEVRDTSIFVPHGQEADYMAALAVAKILPRRPGGAEHDALDGESWLNYGSRDQRMRIGTQDELGQAICEMPGIERAYVFIDVDPRPGGFKDKVITAMAGVKPAATGSLDHAHVSAIRHMVAAAIAGLKPENVTVSDLATGRTWHGKPEDSASADENRYISLKRTYEQDLKAKILDALCYIANVTVETNVELSNERLGHSKPTQTSGRLSKDRLGSAPPVSKDIQAVSAAATQQPNMPSVIKALLGGSQAENAPEAHAAAPTADVQVEKDGMGLTPTVAKVSIGVPMSYFKQRWREQNPSQSGHAAKVPDPAALHQICVELSAAIQRHVAQLLPTGGSLSNAADLVTVTAFPDTPAEERPAPIWQENLWSWVRQSWRTLVVIALALAGLLILRSMTRSQANTANKRGTSESGVPEAQETMPSLDASRVPRPHARRFHEPAASARDELSQLVEHDPDAAASVLRNWIGQVG